ncbi:MAG: TraR/DksA C4-type zinc finger protein [Bacteriovoracaceae bacterium]|jgi:DnaK suppressor protein|nr:TraR/DksA C4-type zinc finger protein [Bacteriovoracaceae bacterium]
MNDKDLEFFRKKLTEHRQKILQGQTLNNLEDLQIKSEDLAEEGDLATNAINQQITFSLRNKEMAKLRRIEAALARIEDGTYGECLESGEEISRKRLETQPWAEFCLEVAEEKEREQRQRRA